MIETRINRLGLAVIALLFCVPVSAAEPLARTQTLEWHGDASSGTPDSETTADASQDDVSQDDVWRRIRSGFKIDDAASKNPLVATQASWYASRPDYVRRMLERSRRYLYHIVQEVDRRSMPTEIALLPMIESAFNSTALSTSAASGIWQFMPATGRHYGLKQDTWYDGRRDFTASTNAALDYLGKLYLDFGDWQLALAAYNCGEGCVARAIQKNVEQGLPTDYASLPLPDETRNYVPKLLAIKNLIRNPEQFGVAIDTLPNQPYFDQIVVHASMDMLSAARLAGMSREEFIALNPAFPRNIIRSDTPVNLLVPVEKADRFQHNLETGVWDSWKPYAAKKGERIEAIARRFNVTVARLEDHNLLRLKRGKLVRAQTLLVPVKSHGVVATQSNPSAPASTDANEHHVQRGDTLFSVARRYGLSVAQLTEANPDLNGHLNAGQTLRLPLKEQVSARPAAIRDVAFEPNTSKPAQPVRYTVRRGDTLHAIARRFDVSLDALKSWNPIFRKSSTIHTGQTVVVQTP
jgi:membrane-bound lytic murein transglycosylase D